MYQAVIMRTCIMLEQTLHSVTLQDNARQFNERFAYIVVAKRTDLEETHVMFVCVGSGRMFTDLSFEGQMQAVSE